MNDLDGVTSSINKSLVTTQNTTCENVKRYRHAFLPLLYSLMFVVGLILNSFTLWFNCCGTHRQVYKSWMIYLKHLTAADFLLCVSLPLRIMRYTSSSFTIYLLFCSFGTSFMFLNMFASILFMGFISVNRYMRIVYTSGTHFLMTTKASHIISLTTWFVLLTMATSYIVVMLITYETTSPDNTCDRLMTNFLKPLYTVIHAFGATIFLLVLFSLVYFYSRASCKVSHIQQKRLGSSNSTKLLKSRRNMLVLVSVFCFCFVPCHVVRLPYVLLGGECSVVFYYLKEFTVFISVSNICLDPLIYIFLCKDFRAQLDLKKKFSTKTHVFPSILVERHREDHLNTINIEE